MISRTKPSLAALTLVLSTGVVVLSSCAVSEPDAGAATRPGPDDLNDRNDSSDPRLKRGLYDNLVEEGLAVPVWDVRMLVGAEAGETLAAHQFVPQPPSGETQIFDLGEPGIHRTGQRVLLEPDGETVLVSFSQPDGNGGRTVAILETIQHTPDGQIRNSIVTLD
jgi:hypothetical protein